MTEREQMVRDCVDDFYREYAEGCRGDGRAESKRAAILEYIGDLELDALGAGPTPAPLD